MRYRPLGNTGLTVSELGFGCGAVGGLMTQGQPEEQLAAVKRAIEAGVTYFDTAQSYGSGKSEENLGRVLQELDPGSHVIVGTKLHLRREHLPRAREHVAELLQTSLKRLGRKSLDLIQQHGHVSADTADEQPNATEMVEIIADAYAEAKKQGLVQHIGFTGLGDPVALHHVVNSGRFETVQSYHNAVNPSASHAGASGGAVDFNGLISAAEARGMGVINIRALAGGALSGSPERATYASNMSGGRSMTPGGEFAADIARAQTLRSIADRLGIETTTELGFRFCLATQGVSTVLIGFSNIGQLEHALTWTERGPLDSESVSQIVATART